MQKKQTDRSASSSAPSSCCTARGLARWTRRRWNRALGAGMLLCGRMSSLELPGGVDGEMCIWGGYWNCAGREAVLGDDDGYSVYG